MTKSGNPDEPPQRSVSIDNMTEAPKIKLSVCIPTLNRGRFIGETLESIISQATPEVEIVIVDGGSTDDTQQIVAQFQQRFPGLRYFRTQKQLPTKSLAPSGAGFDRDCSHAVELAKGEYCWLFTDDDLLKPGAIHAALQAVQQTYDVVVVNAEVRSGDFSRLLEPAMLRMDGDKSYPPEEREAFFSQVANYLSFVGAIIVKRDVWLARDKEPYIGTGFIHIGVLFQRPLTGTALVIAEPLVTIRFGDAHYMGSPRVFEIWMIIWPNLIWSFTDYSEAAKRAVCQKEPWRNNRTLLFYRAMGAFSLKEYAKWIEMLPSSRWERFKARRVASFPGYLANVFALVHYRVFARKGGQFALALVKSRFYFPRLFTELAARYGSEGTEITRT
jgi:abequosyltransferase